MCISYLLLCNELLQSGRSEARQTFIVSPVLWARNPGVACWVVLAENLKLVIKTLVGAVVSENLTGPQGPLQDGYWQTPGPHHVGLSKGLLAMKQI